MSERNRKNLRSNREKSKEKALWVKKKKKKRKALLLKVWFLDQQHQLNYRLHPRLNEQTLLCNKIPTCFVCMFQFEKHQ